LGEVINGGFGMVLDGSKGSVKIAASMLFHQDVNNGISEEAGQKRQKELFCYKELCDTTITKMLF
jgi:urocanate hydratase